MNFPQLFTFFLSQNDADKPTDANQGITRVQDTANEVSRAASNIEKGEGSPIPYVSDELWQDIQGHLADFAFDCLGAVAILFIGWIVSRWLGALSRRLLQKQTHIDVTVSLLLSRLVGWAIMILAIAAAAQVFGLGASMFAAIGAASLAIGLALQGTMSNVASGIMLLLNRPFNVGDAVKLGGEVYIVDEIGLFTVRAHLPDGPFAMVPNTKIATGEVINYSVCHDDMRRLDLTVGIGYEDSIEKAFEVLNGVLDREERVLDDPERLVNVSEMADSSVNILVRVWTKRADWWGAKLDLTRDIKLSLDQAGINIPFPQRDLHIIDGSLNGKDEADEISERFLPKDTTTQQLPLEPKPEPAPPVEPKPEEPVTESKRWGRLRLPKSKS